MSITDSTLNRSHNLRDQPSPSDESLRLWVAELTDLTPAQVQAVVANLHLVSSNS